MKAILAAALVACACHGTAANPGDPDGGLGSGSGSGDPDGGQPAPVHTGGWRTNGHDGSLSHRSETAGPAAATTAKVILDDPTRDANIGTPVIDELGNLYFVMFIPSKGFDLVSLDPANKLRWRVPVRTGRVDTIALGPDGNVYVFAIVPETGIETERVVAFDPGDGRRVNMSAPLANVFDYGITFTRDGKLLLRTLVEQGKNQLLLFDPIDHSPRWTAPISPEGDPSEPQVAVSPLDGSLVVKTSATAAPPFKIVALDPNDGKTERWHYDLDPKLREIQFAVGRDGATYVAGLAAVNSDLHILKLSPTGALEWDHFEDEREVAGTILVGDKTVVVATRFGGHTDGIILDHAGKKILGDFGGLCQPLAIDPNDVTYWDCDFQFEASDANAKRIVRFDSPLGHGFGFKGVLAPNGALYNTFNPINFPPKLIRISNGG